MSLADSVLRNRSYRRFDQSHPVPMEVLDGLVGLARHCASAMNLQPLRYALVADPAKNAEVFECLAWAGYLPDWPGPADGERPAAYIVILAEGKTGTWTRTDLGIAAQTIMLGATEQGLGGCMLGSVKKDRLAVVLDIAGDYEIMLVLALGVPAEQVVIETLAPGEDCKYWRDDTGVHHVPKRLATDIVVRRFSADG